MKKTNVVIIAAAGTILLAIGSAQTLRTQTPAEAVGRYQILAGEHDAIGKTSIITQKDVFRIDTVTGSVSFYSAGYDNNGEAFAQWTPIK